MGDFVSKPEFATVLADQHVNTGEDIVLECVARTENLTAIWQKDGQKLDCVHGKHIKKQNKNLLSLTINNAGEQDEGIYTVILQNKWFSNSCSAMVTVGLNEWRELEWNPDRMITVLRNFQIHHDEVKQLRFLVYGPIGAGKSSVINTIKSIFERRVYVNFLAAESPRSKTIYFKKCEFGNKTDGFLPFSFNDIMGVEQENESGVHTDDIISAIKGHVKDGYLFNPISPLTEPNYFYNKNPSISNRIHGLVYVVPADKLSMIDDDTIQKMQRVTEEAKRMDIPHVVFMTKVDMACPQVKEDLHNVYKSKKINKKMEECSVKLGVQKTCVFPVKNYHEETEINNDINCLMLHALTKIVYWADDYIVEYSKKQPSPED